MDISRLIWRWRQRTRPNWPVDFGEHKQGYYALLATANVFTVIAILTALILWWPLLATALKSALVLTFVWVVIGLFLQMIDVLPVDDSYNMSVFADRTWLWATPAIALFYVVFNLSGGLLYLPSSWLWERWHPLADDRRLVRQKLREHLPHLNREERQELTTQAQALLRRTDVIAGQQFEQETQAARRHDHDTHAAALQGVLGATKERLDQLEAEAQERLTDIIQSASELETELTQE